MKKIITMLMLSIFVVMCFAVSVEVSFVSGNGVSAVNNDIEKDVKQGDKLYGSDIIKTDSKTMIKVKLENGSIVQINPNTEIRVSQLYPEKVSIDKSLWLSSLKSTVSKLLSSDKSETPSAVCGVRGNEVGENRFKIYWDKGTDDPEIAYQKIRELYDNGFYENTVKQLKKFEADYPDETQKANYLLGKAYFALQEYDKSIDAFSMVKDYADDVDFLMGISQLYSFDFESAIDSFKASIGKVDTNKVNYFISLAYVGLGDKVAAKRYRKKIDKNSEFYKMDF